MRRPSEERPVWLVIKPTRLPERGVNFWAASTSTPVMTRAGNLPFAGGGAFPEGSAGAGRPVAWTTREKT